MPRGGGQSGQATIEWAGLILCVALILGALLAGGRSAAKGSAGRELGEAVAERITCAVRGACDGEAATRAVGGAGEGRLGSGGARGGAPEGAGGAPHGVGGAGDGAPREAGGLPRGPGDLPRGLAHVGPLRPGGRLRWLAPPQGGRSGLPGGVRVLGGSRRFLKRTWFACLAYRSWQDDREHPRLLGEPRPVKRTVHMLNECVNPLSFLFGK